MKGSYTLPLGWLAIFTGSLAFDLEQRSASSLKWEACETAGNTTTALSCATLLVPRDYNLSDASDTIKLKLARSKATREPFKGTILMNPGGPGYSGRNDLDSLHEKMQTVLGGHYDIVAWDYRGTGETLPFSCFVSETERSLYSNEQLQQATNASDTAIGQAWATTQWLAAICANSTQANAVGDIIGTAYTARDMMQIVDALGEDGLLRYWGISYGTALGQTVAAMFPDRIDKLLLDAVVNPHEWWTGASVSQISDADAQFDSFLSQCYEAANVCPLASHGTSPKDLATKIFALLDQAKYEPIVFGISGILPYTTIKTTILGSLYARSSFEALAGFLNILLTRNETLYAAWLAGSSASSAPQKSFQDYSPATTKENIFGIRCSDEGFRTDNLTEMLPIVEEFHAESRLIGDITWSTAALACAQWPLHAKERLRSDQFHDVRTKRPMLIIPNKYDPVTSVRAARNTSAAFLGSKLLINEGHGHGLLSEPTLCTIKAIRAYFNDDKLPSEDETFCGSTAPPFVAQNLLEVFASEGTQVM